MESVNLQIKIEEQLAKNLPFVIYRKPEATIIQCRVQNDNKTYTVREFDESGFVFAPFDDKKDTFYIPEAISDYFEIQSLKATLKHKVNQDDYLLAIDEKARNNHVNLVSNGINYIKKSTVDKIVLSRRETISNKENIIHLFQKLEERYKTAFVYCWYHPNTGVWLGATPETLIKVEEENFKTMALAGTQLDKGILLDEVLWGAKEKIEQEVVTEAIVEGLKEFVEKLEVSHPKTHKAGTLLHIKTDIKGSFKNKSKEFKAIINTLHPTPAVCGYPKAKAKAFILNEEGYDRAFYTGFLGEINIDKNTKNTSELFVNLRCMQYNTSKLHVYVGGGITKDSDPLAEWEETVRKTATMKSILE